MDEGCYCEYGEGEPPEWNHTSMRTARKLHQCIECEMPDLPR